MISSYKNRTVLKITGPDDPSGASIRGTSSAIRRLIWQLELALDGDTEDFLFFDPDGNEFFVDVGRITGAPTTVDVKTDKISL
jgi:hypothetical protein